MVLMRLEMERGLPGRSCSKRRTRKYEYPCTELRHSGAVAVMKTQAFIGFKAAKADVASTNR